MDSRNSPQILGNGDFPPLDPTAIVMLSPPSSPEPVTPADDDSSPVTVVGNTGSNTEFAGNSLTERATTTKSPSSAVGKSRISGKERVGSNASPPKRQASAGNVRFPLGKGLAVLDPPSSARGEVRVSGNRSASAGNGGVSTEKEQNAAGAGGGSNGGEGGSRRLLPPTIAASSEQWGSGKWKDDGRRKTEKIDEKTDSMFLKEIIETLIRNSGEVKQRENTSYVEILRSMGIKFPE